MRNRPEKKIMTAENMNHEGAAFLEDVTLKIEKRLDEIRRDLHEGQKEIENMHEYYWDNYTEMDQYGYEDYDNQQALLQQTNANAEKLKMKHRYERMKDAPFFGRVDFIFDGEDTPEPFYIGIGNFAEKADWERVLFDRLSDRELVIVRGFAAAFRPWHPG